MSNDSDIGGGLGCFIVVLCILGIFFYWTLNLDEHFDYNITRKVNKCLKAIEERNWEDYRATIEPSAIVSPSSPASSVLFLNPEITVVKQGKETATVRVSASLKYVEHDISYPFEVELKLVKVYRTGWQGEFLLKSWYLTKDDVELIPFAY